MKAKLAAKMSEKEQFVKIGDGLLVRAPAKINLSLLVAGKRPDGFHEIETVMAKIDWYDEILIEPKEKGIELICEGPEWAPQGEENIINRACEMLLERCTINAGIKITLTKNIPAGSGLGSASSDAAATLIGVNNFLKLGMSKQQLAKIAAELGSDVAFFLGAPLAFCTGKGEKIKKINKKFNFMALLFLPAVSVSTKKVYSNYKHNKDTYKTLNKQINSFLQKNRVDLAAKLCANMLQVSSFHICSKVAKLKKKIESFGVGPICLSGSGSTIYCIIDNQDETQAAGYQRMLEKNIGCKSIIVRNNRW